VAARDLVVATYNIRNGRAHDGWNSWMFRKRATARTLRGLDADAIGLQEVYRFQLRSLGRALPGYEAHGQARDDGERGERVPVLTRTGRLVVLDHRTLWFGDHPEQPGSRWPDARFPRVATLVRVRDRQTAAEFTVASAHLDARHRHNRVRSAEQLVAWVGDEAAVVAIDLNDEEGPATVFDAAGFRDAVPVNGGGTFHGFRGGDGGPRIDRIYVTRHFDVVHAEVVRTPSGGRLGSDHWPVRATIAWTQ